MTLRRLLAAVLCATLLTGCASNGSLSASTNANGTFQTSTNTNRNDGTATLSAKAAEPEEPAVAFISIKPITHSNRESDSAYRIYGETSNNCSKIEVKNNKKDTYALQNYEYGKTSFSYGIKEEWDNLGPGLNQYVFTAHCDGGQTKQTSANINNTSAPKEEPETIEVKETTTYVPTYTPPPTYSAPAVRSTGVVKLSRNGICHAPGTTYYGRTIHYTSYDTLSECLEHGRLPKR